ncbi:MAG: asparagine synthase-related protein, partial [Candidatus Limnocylindria bacterium]
SEAVQETQPLTRGPCVIVADARLDNREELLGWLPGVAAEIGDAELILHAYERWGIDALPRLLGDFAVVIWDPRDQRVVCARDTSGTRLLYYRSDADTFAAASEIQQLLVDPAVPIQANEEQILDFLTPFYVYPDERQHTDTFYAGISLLPAGYVLVVDGAGVRSRKYWDFEMAREVRYRREEEYAEHYRELLFTAVRARLRVAGPIGVLLSGGLDSSSVTCVAQELYRSGRSRDLGFSSFTLTFEDAATNEREFVQEIATKYGFRTEFLHLDELPGDLEPAPQGFREGPYVGPGATIASTFGAASRAGMRVLLTGLRGDLCAGGSPLVFDSLLRHGKLTEAWRRFVAYRTYSRDSLRRDVLLGCVAPLLPLNAQRALRVRAVSRELARNISYVVPAWFPEAVRADLGRRHAALSLARERGRRFGSPARDDQYRFLYQPVLANRYPTPWSVDWWDPYADRRLHEFVLAIPPELHFSILRRGQDHYGAEKQLARKAVRGIVPESIRTRTSPTLFDGALADALGADSPRTAQVFRPPARSRLADRGIIEPRVFWTFLDGLGRRPNPKDLCYVQALFGLESWLRVLDLPRERLVKVPGAKPESAPAPPHAATAVAVATD